jgi:hypothetical protein
MGDDDGAASPVDPFDNPLHGQTRQKITPAGPNAINQQMTLRGPIFKTPENGIVLGFGDLVEGLAQIVRVVLGDAHPVQAHPPGLGDNGLRPDV